MRTSEQIDDDWRFVRIFEPGLVDLLPKDGLWDRRVIVRSSAGGGKTTLLRVFTPGPLRVIHRNGSSDEQTGELYHRLAERGVLDRNGPTIAAALVSLAGKYTPLDQLRSIDEGGRLRAFLALLNVRVMLAALRAHLQTAELQYPDDLERISIDDQSGGEGGRRTTGVELLETARNLERQVAEILSSLGALDGQTLPGEDDLRSLESLSDGRIAIDGAPVTARTVVLLDDVHRLSSAQRALLLDTLLAERTPTPVWVAERREALTPEELLSDGAKDDRDRVIIDIEQFWRGPRRRHFQKLVAGVADRRMMLAPDTPDSSFAAMLSGAEEKEWAKVLSQVEERMIAVAEGRQEFASWVDSRLKQDVTARERAIGMRSLEIRIQRELMSKQLTMDVLVRDEAALTELDQRREASDLREAAELFLCTDYGLPFYFGEERLAQLAFANVDQFLDFGGDLFEELSVMSGTRVLRTNVSLSARRQEELVSRAVKRMWDELGTGVESGSQVRSLLDGIGTYCAKRTYLPNAPYAPSVTGVALRRSQAEELQEACGAQADSWHGRLGRILATLIAHNLVTVQSSEGKGQQWAVFYLNRAWCVRYRLALSYGGWQPTRPDELWSWAQGDAVREQQRMAT